MDGKFNHLARVIVTKSELKTALAYITVAPAELNIKENDLVIVQNTILEWVEQAEELENSLSREISA